MKLVPYCGPTNIRRHQTKRNCTECVHRCLKIGQNYYLIRVH